MLSVLRIPIVSRDKLFPFAMLRRQFPVWVSFEIIANKAIEQTLFRIGVYLKSDFPHGQLYVSVSRAGNL